MGATMKTGTALMIGNERFTDAHYATGVNDMWRDYPGLAALNDPFMVHRYVNDFHDYAAGEWIITTTETAPGNATEALLDGAGGLLLVTPDDAEGESTEFQKDGEAFRLVIGKPLWFEARLTISDATHSDMIVGLCITDTEAIDAVSDGVYFLKVDETTAITYHCEKDGTDTSANTGIAIVAATHNRFGIHWDGAGIVTFWLDGKMVASSTTNIPDDENLCITFGIENGAAAAKTLTIDYVICAQVR